MKNDPIVTSEQLLRTIIEQLDTDVLFESFVGLLIHSELFDSEKVHVIPKENYRRNYKNDIVPAQYKNSLVSEQYFKKDKEGILRIYTSRNGILDYLPEDFYTQPDNTNEYRDEYGNKRTAEEVEAYQKEIKEELESAQRFFIPLEVEYNKVRAERELHEVRQLENFDQLLEIFWNNFPLSNDKWRRFVRTLHIAPFVLGDKEKTKALIEFVLGVPITLSFSIEESCDISPVQRKALLGEELSLGFNTSVGTAIYDYLEVCTLKIEGLTTTAFFAYFDEQSTDRKLLNEIINYYFPLNIDVRLDFSIKAEEQPADKESAVVVLGYSSTLA